MLSILCYRKLLMDTLAPEYMKFMFSNVILSDIKCM